MIDINKILQADVLDIIFDGRNKAYGAYELRTNYSKRLYISVISMILGCGLLLLLYSFANGSDHKPAREYIVSDMELEALKEKKEEIPIVEPPKPKLPEVAVIQFATPIITHEEVKPDEAPPEMEELEDARIGTFNRDGDKDSGFVAPPIDDNKGVIDAPKKDNTNYDSTFLSVQIESEYPGGLEAWKHFLGRALRYPQDAVDNDVEGTVLVQFIVDKDGFVSEVAAISGPDELRGEAVRVIKKSGKWTPALQNGRQVKSYKRQPIVFRLE